MRKGILIIVLLFIILNLSFTQEDNKGLKLINISFGPSFSNLINSEAPHKINIYGSDRYPLVSAYISDITKSLGYFDYKTSLIKDIKIGLSIGVGFEYFLRNDLSIILSVRYEDKGIDLRNNKFSSTVIDTSNYSGSLIPKPSSNIAYYDEIFDVRISNKYLTVPMLIRKYISQNGFYIEGGLYTGYLLKSQIYTNLSKHSYIPNYDFYGYSFNFYIDNQIDHKKEFTSNIDYGLTSGLGFIYSLTKRLSLTSGLLFNLGLRKIDRKYNNEYEQKLIGGYTGISTLLRSTNYFGLNSNAKNINTTITFGLKYNINRL